ncbi:MAG: hypothetical protein R2752_13915 [Vicinamibacterales bacterium]
MQPKASPLTRNLTVAGLVLVLTAAIAGGSELIARSRRAAQPGQAPGHAPAADQAGRSNEGRGQQRPSPSGRTWEWWKDADVAKELQLATEAANRIDQIYQNRNRQMRPLAEKYLAERDKLDQMTRERVASYEEYQLQVQNVESLYSRLRESRIVMLYRMYQVLSQEQYQKFRTLLDRRGGRGRGSRPTPER